MVEAISVYSQSLPNTALNLTRYVGASRLVARRLALR